MEANYMTRKTWDALNQKLQENLDAIKPGGKIAQEIGKAASHGDLSENAEWEAAIQKKDMLGNEVNNLRQRLSNVTIIDDLEINTDAYLKEWRWTGKEARCIIDNTHRDALMVIKGGVNLEALDEQKIIFKINDLVLDEFIPEESYFEKSYNIKKEMLGEDDEFYLTIVTDKTFVPAKIDPNSSDERELGVQISFIYFR